MEDVEESMPTATISPPVQHTSAQRKLTKFVQIYCISTKKCCRLERDRDALAERLGTKRLAHTLSLHKARRWTICEFFYSSVDEPLFLSENDFQTILKEAFPTLKTNMLNKQQWKTIRRLLGPFFFV